VLIVDDFLPDPESVREAGLRAPFTDWKGYDGEVYKRVCLVEIPGVRELIERQFGPVNVLGMGFRLNYGGEMPNAAIHSDMGWGTHAMVLYLSEGEGGTAFWRHKATGAHRIDPGQVALWEQVRDDWNRVDAWDRIGLCEMRFNRAVFYEGANFHSRWPFEAFGTGPQDGRLIAVAFFTPES